MRRAASITLVLSPAMLLHTFSCVEILRAIPQKAISKGDVFSHTVSAASVIAKVTRDRMITECKKSLSLVFL